MNPCFNFILVLLLLMSFGIISPLENGVMSRSGSILLVETQNHKKIF